MEVLSRFSLRFKITLLVVILVGGAGTGFARAAFAGLDDLLMRAVGLGAQTAAQALADTLDGHWLKNFSPDQKEDRKLDSLRQRIGNALDGEGFVLVQVLRVDTHAGMAIHVLDMSQREAITEYPAGTRESLAEHPIYARDEAGFDPWVLDDVPGYYMAAWAPVFHEGKLIGQLMILVDMSYIVTAINRVALSFLALILALAAVSATASYMFASKFEKAAVTDGLMGIYNHKYFKQRLEEEVAKSQRYGQQTSLVLFDIDFFKRVNDTYGHATGDLVLKLMAKWVTEMCRNTDVVCRYGGEEIACILPHTGIAGAQEFAERLRLKISQQVVKDPEEDAEFRVTVSVGVAQWQKGMDMMAMIKGADAALYHSKHTGRNRVTLYHEELLPAPEEMASRPDRTKGKR